MKIVVLSFYYRPDLCAGSFRATALVTQLREIAPQGTQIDVVTTLPNRYRSFNAQAPRLEDDGAINVVRVPLPAHQSGMRDQSRAFAVYARSALRLMRGRHYDLVFATSSRLMTAVLASRIARRLHARLYLDIRDIFVENVHEVLPRRVSWFTRPALQRLERYALDRADKINLVSPGFAPYFEARYPGRPLGFFTNGIDDEFLEPAVAERPLDRNGRPLTIVYAGNLGEGQGLHVVLPGLALAMAGRARFRIIGDGARREALQSALAAGHVRNVELLPPMERNRLLQEYQAADVLFMHLNDFEAFKKVLPSKVFEYAAMRKPVWAGVAGYAAEFVRNEVANAAVFAPCDVAGALTAFDGLEIRDTDRAVFVQKFARAQIAREMAQDILATAGQD